MKIFGEKTQHVTQRIEIFLLFQSLKEDKCLIFHYKLSLREVIRLKIISGIKKFNSPLSSSVVTIGNFDGLHLGHRKIISRLMHLAAEKSAQTVVMTFDPHPRQVLQPGEEFHRLFSRNDLEQELQKLSIDTFVVEPFSRELSQLEPESFINEYILKPLQPTNLVVGYDFSFGANRKGTLQVLEKICASFGISLEVVSAQKIGDQVISSTRIRQLLVDGDVELASQMLGRFFYTEGIVERGEGRGRKLGIPTANLHTPEYILPKIGVYAGWLHFKGARYKAVCNIGRNPTFHEQWPIKVEIHVLDFASDLYGETLRMEFASRLRDEKKFSSMDELKAQIQIDIEDARKRL